MKKHIQLMFRYLKQELLIKQNNNINIKATPKKEGNYNQNLKNGQL